MHENYRDITSRIAEPPKWWDANGTPRYDPFAPSLCPDIYSNTVVLLRIRCQSCATKFDVEMHAGFFAEIHPQKLHYGDPPVHGCVGDTMNCEDEEVLEVWHRDALGDWIRRSEFEGRME